MKIQPNAHEADSIDPDIAETLMDHRTIKLRILRLIGLPHGLKPKKAKAMINPTELRKWLQALYRRGRLDYMRLLERTQEFESEETETEPERVQ